MVCYRAAAAPIFGGDGIQEGGTALVDIGFRSFVDLLSRFVNDRATYWP